MDGHKQHMFLLADPVIAPFDKNTGMERWIRLKRPSGFHFKGWGCWSETYWMINRKRRALGFCLNKPPHPSRQTSIQKPSTKTCKYHCWNIFIILAKKIGLISFLNLGIFISLNCPAPLNLNKQQPGQRSSCSCSPIRAQQRNQCQSASCNSQGS